MGLLVLLSGGLLVHLAVMGGGRGDVIGGWSVDQKQLHTGFAQVLYPFFAGILLMRLGKRVYIKGAFAVCSLLLVVVFCMPRIGGPSHLWMNGLYESFCILFVFPLIVLMGAGGRVAGEFSSNLCRFCGGISYPLYTTHYPLVYLYTAWVVRAKVPGKDGAVLGGLLFFHQHLDRVWLPKALR